LDIAVSVKQRSAICRASKARQIAAREILTDL
jgi:hypothetical protein